MTRYVTANLGDRISKILDRRPATALELADTLKRSRTSIDTMLGYLHRKGLALKHCYVQEGGSEKLTAAWISARLRAEIGIPHARIQFTTPGRCPRPISQTAPRRRGIATTTRPHPTAGATR